MSRKSLGDRGEYYARRALKRRGYRILASNWRSSHGEIDLVADHRGVVCFVEVKTQSAGSEVPAAEEVTALKRRRLTRAALEFLRRSGRTDRPCRFDVVTVHFGEAGRPRVEVITDAFPAAGSLG